MKALFTETARDGGARCGVVTTPRGEFTTPRFMPVGTRGAIRHLASSDMEDLGAQVILANTYHLMLRPGADVIEKLGHIHGFADWNGHVLTDSGGYQIFSLAPQITDEGATFKSTYDGTTHLLTPERAVEVQAQIGADIQMVLDVCPSSVADRSVLRAAIDRTALWAGRGRQTFLEHPDAAGRQCQFGIVQGGTDEALRVESARRTIEVGFDGYAIGGLSVGENRDEMLYGLDACMDLLPLDQPRYFMGLGDPIGIVESVARGVDMFDCVLPTRLARHGTILTDAGRYNLTRSEFRTSDEPLDPDWPGSPAARWSKGYLRHLLQTKEPTAARIITLHNVAWLLRFMDQMADAISEGTFDSFRMGVHEVWSGR
ncbi:MAG: tRNA guanosine(34) transglycosylase Tgt [Acidimicrobiaceae bacterium]|jgi:queuine tRNA-ribosyltransferase|nr:tRNA guanosine(34) transglycosylase Tgt [Acidimicrobiaceae bacterium]MBT5581769.1 tRNA guanosine(34) transglycosylase Tgt [Acidimicrobiaceae bacterium]MBT5849215.1 tRNA guanosine(34) transglycosylase Tgt [Acidimicrobiaceae bacterium]